jgi:hypothetical protein
MKKLMELLITILLVAGLSACDTSTAMTPAKAARTNSKSLTSVEELILSTLKLEETSQAVDKTQVATLLPLWQAYVELQSNNSTATEEVEAVISRIQSSITAEQSKAIDNLELSSQDLIDTMASLGITNTPLSSQRTPSSSTGQDIVIGVQVDAGGGNPPAAGFHFQMEVEVLRMVRVV